MIKRVSYLLVAGLLMVGSVALARCHRHRHFHHCHRHVHYVHCPRPQVVRQVRSTRVVRPAQARPVQSVRVIGRPHVHHVHCPGRMVMYFHRHFGHCRGAHFYPCRRHR